MLEDFDTLEQHAARLGKSKRTLQRWINMPDGLPYCRRGRELLFRIEWTRAWFEQGMVQRNPQRRGRGRQPERREAARSGP
jgi:hypothetical protein